MKKLLLIPLIMYLCIPLVSFIAPKETVETAPVKNLTAFRLNTFTNFDLGYFDSGGVTYHAIGDNQFGGSGNVVSIDINGTPVSVSFVGTWSATGYYPTNGIQGVHVVFNCPQSYQGSTYY